MGSLYEGAIFSMLNSPRQRANLRFHLSGKIHACALGGTLGPCSTQLVLHYFWLLCGWPHPVSCGSILPTVEALLQSGELSVADSEPQLAPKTFLGSSQGSRGLRCVVGGHSVLRALCKLVTCLALGKN